MELPYLARSVTGVDTATPVSLSSSYLQVGKNIVKSASTSVRAWQVGIIALIVLSLFAAVSTRFFQDAPVSQATLQSHSSKAMRQHMAIDAAVFERPVTGITDMLLPVAASPAPPVLPLPRSAELLDSLYNRPPPSASLL